MEKIIGKNFGKFTVIKQVENSKDNHLMFLCKCACGNEQIVRKTHLVNGVRTECKLCSREKLKTNLQHGLTKTQAYNVWLKIKARCYNPKSTSYKHYGAKGITMCKEWLNDPVAFCKWYTENKKEGCSVDRINNDLGYSPENCRFATNKEQQRNKTTNVLIEFQGRTMTASECAEIVGISTTAMCARIARHKGDPRIFEKQWRDNRWRNQYTDTI